MTSVSLLKQNKRSIIARYARPTNWQGGVQAATTLSLFVVCWIVAVLAIESSPVISVLAVAGLTAIMLRLFVLMHECGHGSLFRSPILNRGFGYLFGVLTGMPQYVWSQNHHYHHSTNGNWEKYRGPLSTLTVEEYAALGSAGQQRYRYMRSIWLAPFGGLMYMIINPRVNWIRGSFQLFVHVTREKLRNPQADIGELARAYSSRYWANWKEYRHQTLNNLLLIPLWIVMSWAIGPLMFFGIYLISGGLAGALGLVLFTVQHNFEHASATGDDDWDYDHAAMHGTSFLQLPGWLDWITASIGYHHIHHLSASIPNYQLKACHQEFEHLFDDVKRLTLADLGASLKCLLWDQDAQRIISFREYEQATAAAGA